MKRFLYNYGWVGIILAFIVMVLVMLRIVSPEEVSGERNYLDVPQEIIDACEKWGAAYGISPELMEADAYVESRYQSNAVNAAGTCHGCWQIYEYYHRDRMNKLGVTSLHDVDQCAHVMADYFSELCEEYEDASLALMVYHGEKDAEWKYEQGIMSNYAQEVLDKAYSLEEYHGKHERAHFDPATANWAGAVG